MRRDVFGRENKKGMERIFLSPEKYLPPCSCAIRVAKLNIRITELLLTRVNYIGFVAY